MSWRALWFGPPDRPLFARLYMPESGSARGAVVMCPPFGLEAQAVGRAYRGLGEQLAQRGLAALHIDYDGTGDSAGSEEDPGRLEAWQGSVRAAVELMRSSGALQVSVVAMRLGATVVASVAAQCDLDGLVLWDPCESGRSYLREQALLRAVYLEDQGLSGAPKAPGPPDGPLPVETLGALYQATTAKDLAQLDLASAPGTLAGKVLALFRPERPARPATLQRLERDQAELAEAAGQEELLSVWPLRALLPEGTIGTVVSWLADLAGPSASPLEVAGTGTAIMEGGHGGEVVEEVVTLGPHQLFGILTRSRSRSPAPGAAGAPDPLDAPEPTVVLLNAGKLDHLGPGRLWVSLARSWAEDGTAVLRADLSGLGDSPVRAGRQPDVVYSPDATADISDLVQAVSPAGPSSVVLVGLCSGAYHAVLAGTELRPRTVLAINPVWPTGQPVPTAPAVPGEATAAAAERGGMAGAAQKAVSYLRRHSWMTKTGRWALDLKWWLINRAGGRPRPALVLKGLAGTGVGTLVVCRHYEARLISRGERGVLRRLHNRGGFRLELVPGIDHSLYLQGAREAVVPMLTDQIRRMG